MNQSLNSKYTHTYTLEMKVKVTSNNEKAMDVTAGDMWAAILYETDMTDDEFLNKVGAPTQTEMLELKSA